MIFFSGSLDKLFRITYLNSCCFCKNLLLLPLVLLAASLHAQVDTLNPLIPLENQDFIEDLIQDRSTAEESEFDFNTLFEELEYYRRKPLNLNKATREELADLNILSELQITRILEFREKAGNFISIYELQAVPDLNLETLQIIRPFITVKGDVDDFQIPIWKMIYEGENELYLRWSRVLETTRGFQVDEDTREPRFAGDPNKLYMRFRHRYSNRLSYGITAEKDAGEDFFTGSNPQGFDFYSAHFYLRNYNKFLNAVAIGDYTISFGQGLILHNGFGGGKSAQVLNIKKSGRTIRPYSSVNESNFFRGVATSVQLNKNFELTAFGSVRNRDGNLTSQDTLDNEPIVLFSSFQESGFHRTINEIEDENAIQQTTFGGNIVFKDNHFNISANVLYDIFDKPFSRRIQPYNAFAFQGDRLLNTSLAYSAIFSNVHFFGETAWSDNGGIATLNGFFLGLDRKLDMGILMRFFERDYQALNANPFAETTQGNNEQGIYLGIDFHPNRNWSWSGYVDLYQHPWLRFRTDAPSRGQEFRTRLTYRIKRKLEVFVEARTETKQLNTPDNETKTDFLSETQLTQIRIHVANKVSKSLELRNRVHIGFFDDGVNQFSGYQMHQDIIFKPMNFPLSFTTRFAIFNTDDYAVRFYVYENDLLYSFSIPAYYDRGTRFYINLRYKGIRNLTLEARFAQTYFSDRESIGGGNDLIEGNTRTELKAQLQYKF